MFPYYGIVNSGQMKIVIGPTRQITETDQELRELAFQTDVTTDDMEDFIAGMKGIIRMPFESILKMVRRGDTAALRKWINRAPAIRGGMDVDDAFSHSDSYIQQCELLSSPSDISNLQYRMVLDYTERVERLRLGKRPSKLTIDVANYIHHHMSEPISAKEIAAELFLNRSYLSRKFKKQTGETLTDFILKEKTEEAKRLLRYSDKSLTVIASYLGFSSASHFSRVFKNYVHSTPSEYREKHQ